MSNYKISIIVPAYNAERTISECIQALLDQDYSEDKYEIIVVDNKSTDRTKELIQSFPVTYLYQGEKQSRAETRNKGVQHSRGNILAFLDSDCIADPNWLQEGAKFFKDENVGCVAGKVLSYKPSSWIELYQDRSNSLAHQMTPKHIERRMVGIITANAFYRKCVFNKVGLFREKLPTDPQTESTVKEDFCPEDFDFSYRVCQETDYKFIYTDKSLVYHKHRTSLFELWKQMRRYGTGRSALNRVYATDIFLKRLEETKKYGCFKPFYWELRINQILLNLLKSFPSLFLYCITFDKKHKIQFDDLFLRNFCKMGYLWGHFYYYKKNYNR